MEWWGALLGVLSGAGALVVFEIAVVILALIVVPRGRRPSSALAWILLMVAIPILGVVLFLLIGSPKLPPHRRKLQREITAQIEAAARGVEPLAGDHGGPSWLPGVAELVQEMGGMPMIEGNSARIVPEFDAQLAELIADIDAAERFVHVEFYILSFDETTRPFFDALARARQRGVEVRVLMDHLGSCRYPGYGATKRALADAGVSMRLMLPVQPWLGKYQRPDLRNHRKLVVVDHRVGWIGSLNMIDPSYQKKGNVARGLQWRDVMVRLEGAIVYEVDAIFVSDWYSETQEEITTPATEGTIAPGEGGLLCQIAPSGPAFEVENNLALFNSLIYGAKNRLSITSPYFVPDESLLAAITTAARRGVEVELFVGEIGDQFAVFHAQHSYYNELLEAGVRIYLYPKPAILHAKHVSVDDTVAAIGSSNLDIRSFQLDFELTLLVCGREFVDELRRVEDEYRRVSAELTVETWHARGRWHAFVDDLLRLTSAVQ